jgi:hypothetical protein
MLLGHALQHAYVTSDLDAACELMARRFGVSRFYRPETNIVPLDDGRTMTVRFAHAWIGSIWLELIQPIEGAVAIYRDWLPPGDGFAMRFHHLGVRIATNAEIETVVAEAEDRGFPVVLSLGRTGSKIRYIDTADALGHYIEYLYFADPAQSVMPLIPQNIPGFEVAY